MQKKFILKFKNALNKVLKHKKCSLHEPIFDKIESNYLLNVLKKDQFLLMVKKQQYLRIS